MTTPTRELFREIVEQYLLPMFTGSVAEDFALPPVRNRAQLVTQQQNHSPSFLKLMPCSEADYALTVRRSQPFSQTEKDLMKSFLNSANRLYSDEVSFHRNDTALSVISETVARFMSLEGAGLLFQVLSLLTQWSQETYEGQRIAFSLGIETQEDGEGAQLHDLQEEDFLKVLSNGQDTIVVFDRSGRLVRHECCQRPDAEAGIQLFSPIRFESVAHWTTQNQGRIGVVLSRNGEILLFQSGLLVFAKRRGRWRHFAHEACISQLTSNALARSSDLGFRRALYLSALDVAFARTGGCIGVLNSSHYSTGLELISGRDRIGVPGAQSSTTIALRSIVQGRQFQSLDRLLRQELLSIDGATVLNHTGELVAAGAILRITERSIIGGGRQAAAEALCPNGIGIKISSDGYVRALDRNKEVIFELG